LLQLEFDLTPDVSANWICVESQEIGDWTNQLRRNRAEVRAAGLRTGNFSQRRCFALTSIELFDAALKTNLYI
jgi:hypothetical protein